MVPRSPMPLSRPACASAAARYSSTHSASTSATAWKLTCRMRDPFTARKGSVRETRRIETEVRPFRIGSDVDHTVLPFRRGRVDERDGVGRIPDELVRLGHHRQHPPAQPERDPLKSSEKGRGTRQSGGTRLAIRSGVLELVEVGEHLSRMRGDVRHLIRLADDPVRVDEVAESLGVADLLGARVAARTSPRPARRSRTAAGTGSRASRGTPCWPRERRS